MPTLEAKQVTGGVLNANAGFPYSWFPDGKSLLVRTVPANRDPLVDTGKAIPEGPIVSVSDGEISQNRTYQDLLKNPVDEVNFELLMTSELHRVDLDGSMTKWKEAGMYVNESFSPDGRHVLLTTLSKPFSYVVPYYSFPNETDVYTADGQFLLNFSKQPLLDNLPIGFMATFEGKRSIHWRADQPSTLAWVEALDKGDPAVERSIAINCFSWRHPLPARLSRS